MLNAEQCAGFPASGASSQLKTWQSEQPVSGCVVLTWMSWILEEGHAIGLALGNRHTVTDHYYSVARDRTRLNSASFHFRNWGRGGVSVTVQSTISFNMDVVALLNARTIAGSVFSPACTC